MKEEGQNEIDFEEKNTGSNTFRRRMTQALDAINWANDDST